MTNLQLSKDDQNRFFTNRLTLVGSGNPQASVWFVGIEDGGEGCAVTEEDVKWIESCGREELPKRYYAMPRDQIVKESKGFNRRTGKYDGRKGTKIYRYMDYVVSRGRNSSWDTSRMSLVDADGANTYFQMNLYPLAKPNTGSWPEANEALFGFGGSPKDRQRYAEVVRQARFKVLREFWRDPQHHPVLTVCFGTTYWSDHRYLFELDEADMKPVPDTGGRIRYHPEHHVALTPFFNPCQLGEPAKLLPYLLSHLSKLGVTW